MSSTRSQGRVSVAAALGISLGLIGAVVLAVTVFGGGGTTQPTDSTARDAASKSTPCPDGFLGVHIDAIRDSGRGSVSVAGKLVNHFPVAVAPLSVEVVGRTANGLQAKTSASLAESVLAAGDAVAPGGTLDFVSNIVVFRYTTGQFNDVVNEPTASVDPGDHGLASLLIRGCNSVPGRSDTLVRVQPE